MKERFNKFKKWMEFDPPSYASIREWGIFKKEYQTKAPIRYFLMETMPDFVRPLRWKIENVQSWMRYRVVRYHVLHTGLTPGYYEADELMLNVNFTILKDFVEKQKGWMYYRCHDECKDMLNWKERYIPFYREMFFRNKDLGIKYLEWECSLDSEDRNPQERNPEQAKNAREILRLYLWWENERPNRKEIQMPDYDDQGIYGGSLNEDFDENAVDWQATRKAWAYQEQQEETWSDEDEANLISLIKIRSNLWT